MNIKEISVEIVNKVRNSLTEVSSDFKLVNFQILSCYRGLPKPLLPVAIDLFWAIIRNRNNSTDNKKDANRIYNDAYTPIELLLMDCNCLKYAKGKSKVTGDISNYLKKVRELDDMNVIYCWLYESIPMFTMERETGSWKCYNPSGCVIPKTVKKIIALSHDMIKSMSRFVVKEGKTVSDLSVEKSFCKFLARMIKKMNPLVSSKFKPYDGQQNINEYIACLKETLKMINDFEGLDTVQEYDDSLPDSVKKKFEKGLTLAEAEDMKNKKKKELEDQLVVTQIAEKSLAEELTPQRAIIAKTRREKKSSVAATKTTNITTRPPAQPEILKFDQEADPLKNPKEFVVYYRHCIMSDTGGKVKFEKFESDAPVAAQILDKLIMMGRSDKTFIRAWIKYFFDQKLKGTKAMKSKNVGMDVFMGTLESFNKVYYVEQ